MIKYQFKNPRGFYLEKLTNDKHFRVKTSRDGQNDKRKYSTVVYNEFLAELIGIRGVQRFRIPDYVYQETASAGFRNAFRTHRSTLSRLNKFGY